MISITLASARPHAPAPRISSSAAELEGSTFNPERAAVRLPRAERRGALYNKALQLSAPGKVITNRCLGSRPIPRRAAWWPAAAAEGGCYTDNQ